MSTEFSASNNEERFLEDLKGLLEKGKRNGGSLTEAEVRDSFTQELSDDQMEVIRKYLESNNIGVGKRIGISELLTEEEQKYLDDYQEELSAIEIPEDSVLDAVKLNAMAGDADAQKELAEYMLQKVVDLAKMYAGQGVYIEDLIGAGNEALMIGVKLLAPLEGPQDVEGALTERIMKAMEKLIREDADTSDNNQSVADRINRVADAAHALAQEFGRKVTVMELVGEGQFTMNEVMDAIRITANKIEDIDYKQPQ
ncbi:MAG: hypothetical protein LKG90_02415 [Lachnospiraceae bacterium]|jgi:RNA polymerase primary sigma factor|nr:hypothetical protein [Lachnospiraceae bacterium]MCH4029327.1 hypothetical protein [Lachnospiraceae bacterium]MCH4067822.1 hypothetical protein [Lachnospiraceae bacterium]MCH4113846.1 hypothetical protein [Lachnospiraceae bacterium]MCI1352649.1 hypothetical protein [Lachnospiraceae bacterium]